MSDIKRIDIGRIVGYGGAVWIEGRDGDWRTEPGWIGLFAARKARRYARRYGIQLEDPS